MELGKDKPPDKPVSGPPKTFKVEKSSGKSAVPAAHPSTCN